MAKTPEFDQFAADYDQLMEESLGFLTSDHQYFAQYKVRLVREWLDAEPQHLLDFGCGIGRNLGLFQAAFPDTELHGADVSEKSLAHAAKQYSGVHWHVLQQKELPRGLFDVVFLAGVVHHITSHQRPEVFDHIRCSMASTGQLFIFEHNPLNPITRKVIDRCAFDADAELIRMRALIRLLQDSGFRIQRAKYVLFFPPALHRHLYRLESMLGWCPLGGQYVVCAEPTHA